MMEAVRARGGAWSSPQDVGATPEGVRAAWAASEDPFAMLLLLAALAPAHDEARCEALVAGMAWHPALARERERQGMARPGMTYNGPDRFRFLHLAQQVRGALRGEEEPARAATARAWCRTIRAVLPDPYVVVAAGCGGP